MPEDGETVSTPVIIVTPTESGVIVIGFPSDSSTGIVVIPSLTPDTGTGQGPESEGQ